MSESTQPTQASTDAPTSAIPDYWIGPYDTNTKNTAHFFATMVGINGHTSIYTPLVRIGIPAEASDLSLSSLHRLDPDIVASVIGSSLDRYYDPVHSPENLARKKAARLQVEAESAAEPSDALSNATGDVSDFPFARYLTNRTVSEVKATFYLERKLTIICARTTPMSLFDDQGIATAHTIQCFKASKTDDGPPMVQKHPEQSILLLGGYTHHQLTGIVELLNRKGLPNRFYMSVPRYYTRSKGEVTAAATDDSNDSGNAGSNTAKEDQEKWTMHYIHPECNPPEQILTETDQSFMPFKYEISQVDACLSGLRPLTAEQHSALALSGLRAEAE